jgi:O-methyltransferase involved in polyketide biosynthesis
MSEATNQDLSGVSETLLVTLYLRAMETQRPDALIKDEKAVELVARLGYDFERVRRIPMNDANRLVIILRNRQIDRYAQDFLARHPDAVVVHIGCGLDARFERVAERNGQVEWYDLDFPHVIELRRKLIGDERERYHFLACSALEDAWMEAMSALRQRFFLFMAEGVFPYLEEAQVKWLVLRLRDRFPGAELVFDAISPFELWVGNLRLAISKLGARAHWGLRRGQELEGWGDGIRLLDEWGFCDDPTPRLDSLRWISRIPLLARALRVYHFQLGKAAG